MQRRIGGLIVALVVGHAAVAGAWPWIRWEIVRPPLKLGGLQPTKGPPGTRVTVNVKGFAPGDVITLAGAPVGDVVVTDTSISFTVPKSARSGEVAIARGGGRPAAVKPPFEVMPPAPVLKTFVPSAGPPGSVVTLTLAEASPSDKVRYGTLELTVRERTPTTLRVQIPVDAKTGELFSVENASGTVKASGPFTLVLPAVVTAFDPPRGLPGVIVTITGEHFQVGDEIWLGIRRLEIQRVAATTLTVVVPKNAATGKLELRRGKVTTASATEFVVLAPPVITDFAPTSGPATTRVTLTGSAFTESTQVTYGDRGLKILDRKGTTSITVMVPPDMPDAVFTVKTEGGTTKSQRRFRVTK